MSNDNFTEVDHSLNLDPQRESFKLVKTTKSYTWEIKIMPIKEKLEDSDMQRMKELNEKAMENWGMEI